MKLDELFLQYEKMAYRIAKTFSVKYNYPYEEMVEESVFALITNLNEGWGERSDENKSKFSTWMYRNLYWRMANVCNRRKRDEAHASIFDEEGASREIPAKSNWLERLLAEVSEEGKALIRTIVSAPKDIVKDISPNTPKRAREAVKQFLIDEKDWSFSDFYRSWEEVSACL